MRGAGRAAGLVGRVNLDPATGLGEAGGCRVGHGVTATNLAGRTLTDLVLGGRPN